MDTFVAPLLPATTPRIQRSQFVDGVGYVMAGHLFEDGLPRVIVPVEVPDGTIAAATALLEERERAVGRVRMILDLVAKQDGA